MATKAPFNRRLAALELAVDELEIGMFRSPSGPGTISGKAIKPKTVTAGLVNVSSLEAVNAKTGSLSVTGDITMTAAGSFSAGQTDFDTGVGWWLDMTGATPRFSLGNSGGSKVTWNGTTLSITGTITATDGSIGGWIIGATDLTESGGGGTVGLASSGSVRIWVGSATPSSAPFRVSSTGVATMIGAVIGSAASGARVELNPTNGVSVYDSGGTVRGRLLTTGAGYLGSTDGTSATAALSWTTAGVATINASAITTGTLNASTITVSNLNATNLITGSLGSGGAGIGLGGTNGLSINGNLTLASGGKLIDADGSYWDQSGIVLVSSGTLGDCIQWRVSGTMRGGIYADTAGLYIESSPGGSGASTYPYLYLNGTSAGLTADTYSNGITITSSATRIASSVNTYVDVSSSVLVASATGAVVTLGDAGGTYSFQVKNSSGNVMMGTGSSGAWIHQVTADTTAVGSYYSRIPIYINGNLRYLAVYN